VEPLRSGEIRHPFHTERINMPLELSLLIGVIFGVIASLMAFLIIYNEYQKHRLDRWRLWKEALAAAAVAFCVFFILAVLVGSWTPHAVR